MSTGRAAPLPPEERRDALIRVFLDLARRQGRTPSTSEIAAEAGVAEGTIYRAFPTKETLRDQAVATAFCPAPVHARIEAIDPALPLRERLVEFTRIMQERFTDVFGLMAALGLTQPPNRGAHQPCYDAGHHLRGVSESSPDADCDHPAAHQRLLDTIRDLVADDADAFVVPAQDVVHRIRLLTFSGSHPGIADGQVLTPEQIVDTVLHGLLDRAPDPETLRRISHLDGSHESLADKPVPQPAPAPVEPSAQERAAATAERAWAPDPAQRHT